MPHVPSCVYGAKDAARPDICDKFLGASKSNYNHYAAGFSDGDIFG